MDEKEKQANVKEMIKTFLSMSEDLKESPLKNDFKRFVGLLISSSVTLEIVMKGLEAKIDKAQSLQHDDTVYNAMFTVRFWKKIKDMMIETYQENRGLKDVEEQD